MTINEYQELAMRTANKDADKKQLLLNGALGLSGESGEVCDSLKKHLFQGHDLDELSLAKELGDICWYIAISANALGYTLEEVMQMNVDKLWKRYPHGFDPIRSVHRDAFEKE